jgi:hypothetical protein
MPPPRPLVWALRWAHHNDDDPRNRDLCRGVLCPTLEPVDYDPFAGMQPVDYDPWDGRPMPSTYEESRMDAAQRRLEPVDHDPFADASNLEAADKTLNLTPQERALYQRHLTNLNGPGGVDNPNGSRSTLFQMSFEQDGKTYNIPDCMGREKS